MISGQVYVEAALEFQGSRLTRQKALRIAQLGAARVRMFGHNASFGGRMAFVVRPGRAKWFARHHKASDFEAEFRSACSYSHCTAQ
jgi:hypothetical protein